MAFLLNTPKGVVPPRSIVFLIAVWANSMSSGIFSAAGSAHISEQGPDTARIPSLDVLRGIAISMVIFGHFIPARIALGVASYHVSSFGRGGVLLFFLLSGYLVFRNIEKQDAVTFISRRLFKIFPA